MDGAAGLRLYWPWSGGWMRVGKLILLKVLLIFN